MYQVMLGVEDTALNKTDEVPIRVKHIFQLATSSLNKIKQGRHRGQ